MMASGIFNSKLMYCLPSHGAQDHKAWAALIPGKNLKVRDEGGRELGRWEAYTNYPDNELVILTLSLLSR